MDQSGKQSQRERRYGRTQLILKVPESKATKHKSSSLVEKEAGLPSTVTDTTRCLLNSGIESIFTFIISTLTALLRKAVCSSTVCTLPSSSQGPVGVEVEVVDSFAVTFLVEDFLLNLQIPQTPRVIIAETDRCVSTVCVY